MRGRRRGALRGSRDPGDGRHRACGRWDEPQDEVRRDRGLKTGQSYQPPAGGRYFEIAIKPSHPPIKSPPELIPPPKNLLVFEGQIFFIYEEKLAVGDTRPRHSHSQRVEIRLNQGPQLVQQIWRDGAMREQHPAIVNWREPVIHEVKNVGDMALRNFILEFLPERPEGSPVRLARTKAPPAEWRRAAPNNKRAAKTCSRSKRNRPGSSRPWCW